MCILAELALDDLGSEQLVAWRDRREDTSDRDAVAAAGDRPRNLATRVAVERRQVPAVELDPAGHDGRTCRYDGGQVGRPFEHRPDAEAWPARRSGSRPRDAACGARAPHLSRALVPSIACVILKRRRLTCRSPRPAQRDNPAGHIGRRRHFALAHLVGAVQDHCVSVGSRRRRCPVGNQRWHRELSTGRNRSRSRTRRPPFQSERAPPDRAHGIAMT